MLRFLGRKPVSPFRIISGCTQTGLATTATRLPCTATPSSRHLPRLQRSSGNPLIPMSADAISPASSGVDRRGHHAQVRQLRKRSQIIFKRGREMRVAERFEDGTRWRAKPCNVLARAHPDQMHTPLPCPVRCHADTATRSTHRWRDMHSFAHLPSVPPARLESDCRPDYVTLPTRAQSAATGPDGANLCENRIAEKNRIVQKSKSKCRACPPQQRPVPNGQQFSLQNHGLSAQIAKQPQLGSGDDGLPARSIRDPRPGGWERKAASRYRQQTCSGLSTRQSSALRSSLTEGACGARFLTCLWGTFLTCRSSGTLKTCHN